MYALGVVLSLAIGVSLGLLGGGGSILTVPVIHYVFGVAPQAAISMSLVVVGATAAAALVPHARAGRVRWTTGLSFGGASMAGAFLGGRIGTALPAAALIPAFAAVMVATGLAMLWRARGAAIAREPGAIAVARVILTGVGVGLLTGVLGAGGGFIIVPALTLFGGLAMPEAVATSLLVIALNSGAGLAGRASAVAMDGAIVVATTLAAIAGSVAGARLVRRLSARRLQQTFGWFVIVVGSLMLVRELT